MLINVRRLFCCCSGDSPRMRARIQCVGLFPEISVGTE